MITVTGTGFISSTVIEVGGVADPTTYVSSTEVTALVPSTQLAAAGAAAIVASNGGTSVSPASASLQVNNPLPAISQISPTTLTAGAASTTVTITGTGFVAATTVQVDGSSRQSTFVSGTQLTAVLTAADLAAGGTHSITAVNAAPGGGTSAPAALAVDNPAPALTSLSPGSIAAGTATATTVTATGTGFVSGATVQVNGSPRPTAVVSATQLTFQLTAGDQAAGANLSVAVVNPPPGGGNSGPTLLPITNPVPTITQVNPATLTAGSAATSVTVTGTNFVSSTVIQVAGSSRPTTFVSTTQVTVQLTAADLASAGGLIVTAVNAAPGGGSSAAAAIVVTNPVPVLLTISPYAVVTGAATPTTITLTGTNFLPVTTVQVGGSPRTTTYVSPTQLTFQLTIADQAAVADLGVTVVNPAPGGGTSYVATLFVAAATPTVAISSITPNQIVVGSTDTIISLTGTGFTQFTQVQWNGISLATSDSYCFFYYSYTPCISATVPASLLTTVGTANITVYSPTATPSVSNTLQVAITNPPVPTLTFLSVSAGPINTAASISLSGTGFTANSSVTFNGSAVPTTFVNSQTLTAAVPASSLATPGVLPITVVTPAPGGGTSNPLYFTAYLAIPNNSMVYNPANGLFYLSVPSAAGAPYGNTIVPVDPLTGSVGTPIPVGSEPDRLAITSDGKYLWVALDGAAAVRQVDLTTGTAGFQFPIGTTGSSTSTVAALAALPGSPNSVVVSTYYTGYSVPTGVSLSIYDSGVARPNIVTFATYAPYPWALVVNGTTSEIYGPGSVFDSQNYITYSYDANGVTQKSSTYSSLTYAESNYDDIQIVGGTLYTSYGQGVDAETGALLGTFYSSGTTPAQGSITVDAGLNKAFILEGSQYAFAGEGSAFSPATLGAFNTADYSATADTPLGVSIPVFRASYQYQGPTGSRLTRWGSDGLAFRGTGGFVSLRSSLVQNLSAVSADVAVSVAAPSSASTGANVSYTATVTNNGPSAASSVSLVAELPASATLVSATPSTGSCAVGSPVVCDLGGLANGASANIVFTVLPLNAGAASLSAQVSASETDPSPANNNASGSVTVSGSAFNVAPSLTAISPAAIVTGSPDTQITLTGTGFTSGAAVQLNGAALQSTVVSATQMTATVPAASLAALGWGGITVSNPAPGGGTSASVPLYVFSVLAVNASEMVFDPYSRKLMAGLAAGTSSLAANSLVAITPETASVGTPVALAGTPANLAISSDGQFVYALLPSATAASVARFNMLTQQVDFTASGFVATGYNQGLRDIAAQPGHPNTVAVDQGEYPGTSIFDFDSATQTATPRGQGTGGYTGTCLTFLNASQLSMIDLYGSVSPVEVYSVTANGLVNGAYPFYVGAALTDMNCTKADGNLLFGQAGGVASLSGTIPVQAGIFEGLPFVSNYASGIKDFAPDASLGRSFYLTSINPSYSAIYDSITAFDIATYMPSGVLTLPFSTFETANSEFTGVDMVRWGQDGLAALSSGGNIYLVRGPVVVPGLLGTNTAATLASTPASLNHGAGNTLLTLTGTNFQPGAAVTWNGSYRTTTVVSPTQVTVAIPASDIAAAGTATLVATNPGAPASAPVTITIR